MARAESIEAGGLAAPASVSPSFWRTFESIFWRQFGMLLQEHAGVFAALAQPLPFEAEPGSGFFDDSLLRAQIEQVAFAREAFAVKNVDLRFAERRRDLVLDDFDLGAIADD